MAGLGGCASLAGENDPVTATDSIQKPLSKAFVTPPTGGPAMLALVQTTYSNAVAQEIALATPSTLPGQNAFYVAIYREPNQVIENRLPDRPLSRVVLRSEMNERLPGVAMKVSLYYAQNRYGPFGYAVGRAPSGELCLYGWQRISPDQPRGLVDGTKGAVSIRLRLCDTVSDEAELLSAMYGFTVNAYVRNYSWNPFGDAPSPAPGLGKTGAATAPIGPLGPASAIDGPFGRPPPPATDPQLLRARRPAAIPTGPAQGYPVVPEPPAAPVE